jgi:hypothetical protein
MFESTFTFTAMDWEKSYILFPKWDMMQAPPKYVLHITARLNLQSTALFSYTVYMMHS